MSIIISYMLKIQFNSWNRSANKNSGKHIYYYPDNIKLKPLAIPINDSYPKYCF